MIFMKTQSNFYLFLIALISAMGGFLFGYDWVVIGGAKPFYEQYFGIAGNPVMQGWAMSSALIGCLFGALSAGKLSDRLGRKPILILAAGLFICTAVGTGAVHSFTFFNVFRLVGGFAIGIASSLSPMYIAEIAPAHLRGRFVSINQLTVVLGILTSQIVNWQIAEPVALGATHEMIRESWNGQMGWRWMFWAMTVPAALFFVFSFILPESPRWLASSGKREAALKVFTRMGGKEYAVHPCRHTDPAVLFQPHRAYDTDPHRGGNRRNGPLCRQHPQRTLLALGIRQRGHITRTERKIRVQETGTLPSTPSSGRRTGKETDHHSTQEPG